ncbi:MAG: glycosyltransferase [Candidatus Omnitrophica bacterium]|nr:glycosyltransferase [Candidatus Omnitrophota bacterium]
MNILMMSNTYTPIVGGIEKSIMSFARELRKRSHRVIIVAPEFKGQPEDEEDVIRVPAIQNFNGTDFSVELPLHGRVSAFVKNVGIDIVHSHHPFLVGDTAVRFAAQYGVPLVFTYHTMYELNTHYVPGDSQLLKDFAVELVVGYCNLADHVLAPSQSVKKLILGRGVKTPVTELPTGLYPEKYSSGSGRKIRQKAGVPEDVFLAGYVGRVAEEKNMDFLCEALERFLRERKDAHFLLVGGGDMLEPVKERFREKGWGDRVHASGFLKEQDLTDAYHAMDILVFASKSETQGLVLAEAMAAGAPVVALDAPGTREVVKSGRNGTLIHEEDKDVFARALMDIMDMDISGRKDLAAGARRTAAEFSMEKSVKRLLDVYEGLVEKGRTEKNRHKSDWVAAMSKIKAQLKLTGNMARATGTALSEQAEKHRENRDES